MEINKEKTEEEYFEEKKELQKNSEDTLNIEKDNNESEQKEEDVELESTSTYILKYTRKGDELKEISVETGLRKSENCLFMLNIKLIKSDSVLTEDNTPQENSENFLVFCCHEIAAIYFDEIYERVYTLDDLIKENKHFRALESTEEAKNVIDKTIRKNEKNDKKIFLKGHRRFLQSLEGGFFRRGELRGGAGFLCEIPAGADHPEHLFAAI